MGIEITVRVVYLGGSRGETGCGEEVLQLPAGSTIKNVANAVARRHPRLRGRLETVRWARNHEFAKLTETVVSGDEIALIPPVAGGAPDHQRGIIQSAPLDVSSVIDAVRGPEMGAVVTFIGTVRNHSQGKAVASLDYEAYEPMASKVLERIVDSIEAAHPGVRLAIHHRIGLLLVGEQSVAIAAASPHRNAAYAACRDALESIKRDLPIWKRETTPDGDVWVGWGGG